MPNKEEMLIQDIVERWRAGERLPGLTKMASEVLGRPLAIGSVRYWVVKALGGAAAYAVEAAKREEAHPRPRPVPPKRGEGARVVVSDEGVPVIHGMPMKKGWVIEVVTVGGWREEMFVSPDGTRYIRAKDNERADLIVDRTSERIGHMRVRLRLESGSRMAKRMKRERRLVAAGARQKTTRIGKRKKHAARRTTTPKEAL